MCDSQEKMWILAKKPGAHGLGGLLCTSDTMEVSTLSRSLDVLSPVTARDGEAWPLLVSALLWGVKGCKIPACLPRETDE